MEVVTLSAPGGRGRPDTWSHALGRPLVIGHRGAPRAETENTLPSFQYAVENGADGIELDVWMCRDGQLAVYHDATITVDGETRPVRRLGLIELRQAVQEARGSASRHVVPLLAEVLDAFQDILINIELKTMSVGTDGLEAAVVSRLTSEPNPERILVSSFNPLALMRVRRMNPHLGLGLLTAPDLPRPLSHTWFLPLLGRGTAVHPREDMVSEGYPPLAAGRRIHAWTINDPSRAQELARMGVHAIITDIPETLAAAVAE